MTASNTRRVLITGANGIGRAMAGALRAAGAQVHVCEVDERAVQPLRQDWPDVSTSPCDVGDLDSVQRMMAQTGGAFDLGPDASHRRRFAKRLLKRPVPPSTVAAKP